MNYSMMKPGFELKTNEEIPYFNSNGDKKKLEIGTTTVVKFIIKEKAIVDAEGYSFIINLNK